MSQRQQKQRNWFARHKVLTAAGAIVAVVAIGGVAAGGGGDDEKSDKSKDTSAAGGGQGGEKKEEKKKGETVDGDGTLQVGTDIKPGTYRSVDNGEDDGCYWERAKDSSGEPDSILANDNVVGASYVTVKATDKIFKSTGCADWELVPTKETGSPKTEVPGSGMYKVGVDIAPGTYKSTGNTEELGCYWERDKDALHDATTSIIANENVTGNGVVTIAPGDVYFKTNGCATWKKAS
ncbi:hypothetical protein [Streptomyces sp. SAJ15]|uniref:hypothetical protein n=1 Tax=Streptomyces sp. SAJ15 TaxID=2011095 RepID=UPI001185D624|nr:hypothetical protein [Streptomyces sp. SAJ15]TVL88125.1 hypothetical protein CD790_31285 [Streptomyces sp. SAJ15]